MIPDAARCALEVVGASCGPLCAGEGCRRRRRTAIAGDGAVVVHHRRAEPGRVLIMLPGLGIIPVLDPGRPRPEAAAPEASRLGSELMSLVSKASIPYLEGSHRSTASARVREKAAALLGQGTCPSTGLEGPRKQSSCRPAQKAGCISVQRSALAIIY